VASSRSNRVPAARLITVSGAHELNRLGISLVFSSPIPVHCKFDLMLSETANCYPFCAKISQ